MKVSGESLSPEFHAGDFVIVVKSSAYLKHIKKGDVIVFHQSNYGVMIKKVDSISSDKKEIFVKGIHEDSIDSKNFGSIIKSDLIGKVIWHIKKPNLSVY